LSKPARRIAASFARVRFIAVQVKQVEGDHHDLFGTPREFVLTKQGEVRGVLRGTTISPSISPPTRHPWPCVGCDLRKRLTRPVRCEPGEHTLTAALPEMDLDPGNHFDLISCTQRFGQMPTPLSTHTNRQHAGSIKPLIRLP